MQIRFAYNRTSWLDGKPVPDGMAERLVQPIVKHLPEGSYIISDRPMQGDLNVYLSMPGIYGTAFRKGGVHLAHGCADKTIRTAKRQKDAFAYTMVPGPYFRERTIASGVPEDQVINAGYTKLDPLVNGEVEPMRRDERIRVLVAPTQGGGGERYLGRMTPPPHPGAERTSWWRVGELISFLDPEEFDIVLCPHPRHRPRRKATFREYVNADVVIADGGSTLYEAMALGIPIVTPNWITEKANVRGRDTLEAQVYRKRIGYPAKVGYDLPDRVREAAERGLKREDKEFIDGVIDPNLLGKAGKAHADFLLSLL